MNACFAKSVKRAAGRVLAVILLAGADLCSAASSTTLGPSDAHRCFEESRFVFSGAGLEACNRAIQQGDLTIHDLAATYSNRGIIYANNGKFKKALADHNKAIELAPNLGQAYINRGNVYYHTRDYERALKDYDRAIALGATPVETAWYNKALALIRLKRDKEAKVALEEALKIAPESTRVKQRLSELKDIR